ncbi:Pectinesterase, catalytic [Corchorus olitorius]|uniref:pectinesterase n=1 Tax=Corchorus olitorius TaxID=93759 RepID=A0A1R3G0W1_9ROSI|nr:Pectinesterase, catalytic [Corchorus olitorius]
MGDVLEVDPSMDWYLKVRVEIDVTKPLQEGTTLTTPAVAEMKVQGFVDRRFSPNLKADSPTVQKGGRLGGYGKLASMDSAQIARRAIEDERKPCDKKEDSSALKGDARTSFLPLVARSKQVGDSDFFPITRNLQFRAGSVNRSSGNQSRSVYGNAAMEAVVGAGIKIGANAEEGSKNYGTKAVEDDSDEHADIVEGQGEPSRPRLERTTIPGIGPSLLGLGITNVAAQGRPLGLHTNNEGDLGYKQLQAAASTKVHDLLKELAATSPFVFGENSSTPAKTKKKWKKVVRVSSKYSFDVLGPQTNFKDGKKQVSSAGDMEIDDVGIVKKSREARKDSLDPELATAEAEPQIIKVKKYGSGDFDTITKAITSVPPGNTKRVIISIGPGVYKEKVKIDRMKPFITLLGDADAIPNITFGGGLQIAVAAAAFSVTISCGYIRCLHAAIAYRYHRYWPLFTAAIRRYDRDKEAQPIFDEKRWRRLPLPQNSGRYCGSGPLFETLGGTAKKYGTVDSATLIVESDYFNSAPKPDGVMEGAQAAAL